MAKIQFRDSTTIGDYMVPYFIAEINTSHFGDISLAKDMIKKAKEIGCDCVKFQSWTADTLYSKTYYDENPIAKRFVKKFSFSQDELLSLSQFCKSLDIGFSSTPYSRNEVDFLVNEGNAPFIKIASMELNNYLFLSYIAKTGVPIVLSTGMGDLDEIKKAVKTIEAEGNTNISILHCVSIYPPEPSTIQLNNIIGLRKEFPNYPIGFSDHTLGVAIPTASIALGACIIEKHFTLDKSKIGMDNQMASEPSEMELLIDQCKNVQQAMGTTKRVVSASEIEQRKNMRRSVIVTKDLSAGTQLQAEDLDVKRPGTGISPEHINNLIGKSLTKDVIGDTLLMNEDFS